MPLGFFKSFVMLFLLIIGSCNKSVTKGQNALDRVGLSKISGDQYVLAGQAATDLLTVQVNGAGSDPSDIAVRFEILSGSVAGTISSTSALTDGNGRASVALRAGINNGTIKVRVTLPQSSSGAEATFEVIVQGHAVGWRVTPVGTVVAGTPFNLLVEAVNLDGSVDSEINGPRVFNFTTTSGNSPGGNAPSLPASGSYNVVNGIISPNPQVTLFNSSDVISETFTVSVSGGMLSGTSAPFNINDDVQGGVSIYSTDSCLGSPVLNRNAPPYQGLIMYGYKIDSWGNCISSSTGNWTKSFSDAEVSFTSSPTATHSVQITPNIPSVVGTVTFTEGAFSDSTGTITASNATAHHYAIIGLDTVGNFTTNAGEVKNLLVRVEDIANSLTTTYDGPHTLTWTTTATGNPANASLGIAASSPSIPTSGVYDVVNGIVSIPVPTVKFVNSSETPVITVFEGASCAGNLCGVSQAITVNDNITAHAQIRTAASNGGSPFNATSLTTTADSSYALYCATYDALGNYKSDDVTADWGVTGDISVTDLSPGINDRGTVTYNAQLAGSGKIYCDVDGTNNGTGIFDDTGLFTIAPGAPYRFALDPGTGEGGTLSITAGSAFPVTVRTYDSDNNLCSNFTQASRSVTVSYQGTTALNPAPPSEIPLTYSAARIDNTAGNSKTYNLNISAGTATIPNNILINDTENSDFPFMRITDSGSILAGNTGLITVNQSSLANFSLMSAANASGVFINGPNLSTDGTLTMFASGFDAFGNFVGDQNVNWTTTPPSGTCVAGELTGNPAPLTNTISARFDPTSSGACVISAYHAGLNKTDTTGTINVSFGTATKFNVALQGGATTVTAGTPFNIIVQAYDAGNNLVTDYAPDFSFVVTTTAPNANNGQAPTGFVLTTSDFVNGVATISGAAVYKAGTNFTITAAENGGSTKTGTSVSISVTPNTLHHYATSSPTGPFVADGASGFGVTVEARDQWDNLTTTGIATPFSLTTVRTSDEALVTTIGSGTGISFGGSSTKAATGLTYLVSHGVQFIASDANGITTPVGLRAAATFTPHQLSLKSFTIDNFSTATPTAGTAFTANVNAKDIAGNTITGLDAYLGTLVLTGTGAASNSPYANASPSYPTGFYAFTNGVSGNISYTLYAKETVNKVDFVVTSGAITGNGISGTLVVGGAALNHYSNDAAVTSINADGVATFTANLKARDFYGNIVAGNSSISIVPYQLDGNNIGSLGGTTAGLNLSSGSLTVSNLTYNVVGSMELRTSGGTVLMDTTRSVDYTMVPVIGSLHHYDLAFTGPATAGSAFAINVQAKDAGDNLIPNIQATLNARNFRWTEGLNTSPESDVTIPASGANFSLTFNAAGVASTNITFVKAQTLALAGLDIADNAATNIVGTSEAPLIINPNVAHHFVFLGATTGVADNTTNYSLTIESRDDWGNLTKTNSASDASLTLVPVRTAGVTNVGTFTGSVTGINFKDNASVTIANVKYGVAHTTKFAFSGTPSITPDDSLSTQVAWSPNLKTIASYTIEPSVGTTVAGAPVSYLLKALDQGGNIITNGDAILNTVSFTFATSADCNAPIDPSVLYVAANHDPANGTKTFTSGVATVSYKLFNIAATCANAGDIAITDTTNTIGAANLNSITVTPATLASYATLNAAGPFVADGTTTFSVDIQARDVYGNPTNVGTGSPISLTANRLADEATITTIGGGSGLSMGTSATKTFTGLTYLVSHQIEFIATDGNAITSAAGVRTNATFTAAAATVKSYEVNNFSTGTPTAGTAFTANIYAKDIAGNVITGLDAILNLKVFTAASGASNSAFGNAPVYPSGSYAFTNGVSANISYTLYKAETVAKNTFSVTDGVAITGTGTTGNVVVSGADLNQYSNEAVTTSINADGVTTFSATIKARDLYGNVVAGNASINLIPFQLDANTVGTLGGTTTAINMTTGTQTISNLTYNVAGSMEIRVTGGTVSMNSAQSVDYTMVPTIGTLHHYNLTFTGPATAGSAFPITVIAKDAFENTIPNIETSLNARQFRWTAGLNTSPESDPTIPAQAANFSLTFNAAGTATANVTFVKAEVLAIGAITFSDNGTVNKTGTSTAALTINPNIAHHIVMSGATTGVADNTTSYTLTIQSRDDWGNPIQTNNAADAALTVIPTRVSGYTNVGPLAGTVTANLKDNATVILNTLKYQVAHTTKFAFQTAGSIPLDNALSTNTVAWSMDKKTVASYTIEPDTATGTAGVNHTFSLKAFDGGANFINAHDSVMNTISYSFITSADCNAPAPSDTPTTYAAGSYDPANGVKTFTTGVASLTYRLFNAVATCANAGDISVTDENSKTASNTSAVTISPNVSNYIATTSTGFPATADGTAQTSTNVKFELRDTYGNPRSDAAVTAAALTFAKTAGYGSATGTLQACSPVSGDTCGAGKQNVTAITLSFASASSVFIYDINYNVANTIAITATSGAITTPAAYKATQAFNPSVGTVADIKFERPAATGVAGAAQAWKVYALDGAGNTMTGAPNETVLETIKFTVTDMSGTSQMNGPESGTVSFPSAVNLDFNNVTGIATTNLTFFNAANNVAQGWLRLTNDKTPHVILNAAADVMDITYAAANHFHVTTAGFTGSDVADGTAKTATSATISLQDVYGNPSQGLAAVTLAPVYVAGSGYASGLGSVFASTTDGGARVNITTMSLNFTSVSSVTIYDFSYNIFQTIDLKATSGAVTNTQANAADMVWDYHTSTVASYKINRVSATGVAGTATSWQVKAYDAANNLMTGATVKADLDTRTLTITDSSVTNLMNGPEAGTVALPAPATYTWVSGTGIATISVTAYNKTNGIAINYLTVTDGSSKTGKNIDAMTISGAAGNHFHVTAAGFPINADSTLQTSSSITITLQDAYGNTTTDATMTSVPLTLSRISGYTNTGSFTARLVDNTGSSVALASLTPSFNASPTVTYYDATYDVAHTFEIIATKGAVTTTSANSADLTANFNNKSVKNYSLSFAGGTAVTGATINATLTALDGGGNVITGSDAVLNTLSFTHAVSGNVYDAPNASQTVTANLPATGTKVWSSGTTSVPFKFFRAGTVAASYVSVTDTLNAITKANSDTATITPGAATALFIPNPLDAEENTIVNVTLYAVDAYGNQDTAFQDDPTLALSGSATGAGVIDMVNGTAITPVSDAVRETVLLTLTYPGLTNGTEDIEFTGPATSIVFATQPNANQTQGNTFGTQPIVELRDSNNVRVRADSTTVVTLSAFTDPSCTTPATGTLNGTTVTLNRGRGTYTTTSFSNAATIYLKANTGVVTACSNATIVYPTMAIDVLTGGGVAAGTIYPTQTYMYSITGGRPPITVGTSTLNSAGSLSAVFTGGACAAGKSCVTYTAGSTVGVIDTLIARDSSAVVNSVTDQTTVNGALLSNTGASTNMGSTFTDISRTYTISNTGNIATGNLSITFTPDVASYWTKTSDACNGVSLAAASSCNIVITFKGATGNSGNPANGAYSATLAATGATNGSLNLNLTVNQDGAILNTISGSGSFGSVSVDTLRTITIRNDGNANSGIITNSLILGTPSDWTFGGTCAGMDLAPNATCTVTVTFNASTVTNGSYTGTLRVKGASSEEEVISLSATRTGGLLTVVSGNATFGSVTADTTNTITLRNDGTANTGTIVNTLTAGTASDWIFGGTCAGADLAPAATCTVTVTFKGSTLANGSYSGTYRVKGPTSDQSLISLSATRTGGLLTIVSGNGTFGSVGTDTTNTVTIRNDGTASTSALVTTLLSGTGSDWTFGGTCSGLNLAPAATCTVTILFKGSTLPNGAYSGNYSVKGATSDEKQIALSATRVGAILALNSGNVAFGSSATNITRTYTYQNTGTASTGVITTTFTPSNANAWTKSADNCNGVSLAASATCTVDVTFTPQNASAPTGANSATLQVQGASGGNITSTFTGTKP